MASTSTFTITGDQVILASLRKLGVVEPGDTASTVDPAIISNASDQFNLMIKQWSTSGIKLWTVVEITLPLVSGKTTYTIGSSGADLISDKPLKLIQAWLRNTVVSPNIDTPMQLLSKQEYNILGSKASTGTANSVFMDVGVNSSTVYLYLTPDALASTTYTLHLVVQRPIYDVLGSMDTPDFPSEWMNALVWGLADELALEFDVPANHRQEIMLRATKYREHLEGWDTEYYSSFFTPDTRMAMRSF